MMKHVFFKALSVTLVLAFFMCMVPLSSQADDTSFGSAGGEQTIIAIAGTSL
jgi:hypothetical protein